MYISSPTASSPHNGPRLTPRSATTPRTPSPHKAASPNGTHWAQLSNDVLCDIDRYIATQARSSPAQTPPSSCASPVSAAGAAAPDLMIGLQKHRLEQLKNPPAPALAHPSL